MASRSTAAEWPEAHGLCVVLEVYRDQLPAEGVVGAHLGEGWKGRCARSTVRPHASGSTTLPQAAPAESVSFSADRRRFAEGLELVALNDVFGLARASKAEPALVRRLKRAVMKGPRFDASESDVARELGFSARSLRRRLRELGTSYACALAEVRFAFAKECLADTRLTIGEVADRLGYSEVSNFRIAFKRWANCSPRTYRNSLGRLSEWNKPPCRST